MIVHSLFTSVMSPYYDEDERYYSRYRDHSDFRGRAYFGGRGRKPRGGFRARFNSRGRTNFPNRGDFRHDFNDQLRGSNAVFRDDSYREQLKKLGLTPEQIESIVKMNDMGEKPKVLEGHTSDRDAFRLLSIFCKLHNHKKNWNTMPKSLHKGLLNFIANINLPSMDDAIRSSLQSLVYDFEEKICNSVQFHLLVKSETIVSDVKHFSRSKFEEACSMVERSGRFDVGLLDEAFKILSTEIDEYRTVDVVNSARDPNSFPTPQESVAISKGQIASTDMDKLNPGTSKRHRDSPDDDRTTNKKSNTNDLVISDDDDDMEESPVKSKETSPVVDSNVAKFKDNIIIHPGRDQISKWNVAKLPIRCRTLVIGDSTLRHWDTHERVYIQVFPGAHITDIARLLSTWPEIPTHLSGIVVNVGVNNHSKSRDQNKRELSDLIEALNAFMVKKVAIQVAISPDHSSTSKSALSGINNSLKSTFGGNFICLDNNVVFVDTQHYDIKSASAISQKVYQHLN